MNSLIHFVWKQNMKTVGKDEVESYIIWSMHALSLPLPLQNTHTHTLNKSRWLDEKMHLYSCASVKDHWLDISPIKTYSLFLLSQFPSLQGRPG